MLRQHGLIWRGVQQIGEARWTLFAEFETAKSHGPIRKISVGLLTLGEQAAVLVALVEQDFLVKADHVFAISFEYLQELASPVKEQTGYVEFLIVASRHF